MTRPKNPQPRKCLCCGGPNTRRKNAKYCSKVCYRRAGKSRYKETHEDYFRNYSNTWQKAKRKRLRGPAKNKWEQARALGFRSMFEVEGAEFLKKEGISFTYETARVPYTLTRYYTPDFSIVQPYMHIEFKGFLRTGDLVKMRAVKRCNPDLDIRFVFQDASKKIRKGSKLTYGGWADKYGFPWAEGKIPKAWLKSGIKTV